MTISKVLLRWLLLFLAVQAVLRGWMYWYAAGSDLVLSGFDLAAVFTIGAFNDAMLFALLAALLILAALPARVTARPALFITLLLIVLLIIVDIFFWIDFDGRADRLVFHYLAYPIEVLSFLEDQFALSLLIVPLVLLVYIGFRALRPELDLLAHHITQQRLAATGFSAVVLAGLITLQLQPLMPWQSRYTNDLGANGMQKVLHASLVDAGAWDGVFPTAAKFDRQARASVHYDQPLQAAAPPPKHVLLVIEESFAGPNWWDKKRRAKYMPNFDRWRKKGVYLNHLMATGTRTTRGVEALLHGVPPLPGIALNQREGFSRLPSLPRALKAVGFDTVFVYGGWPGFSNFKNYWSGVGFDTVLTRDNFENKQFETSWGVADEVLFERVLNEMDTRTATSDRVFLSTLTVSNHRPYDFPAGRIPYPSDQRKQEFAVAYADWALGQFLQAAEKKSWFKDTLIVIVPDHGPNPAGDTLIPVESYRLPGIVLIPGLAPTVRKGVGSLMDLPTTIMHQLCLPPVEGFMGRNLLAENISGVAPVEYDYMLGLYDGDSLTVLRRDQSILAWRKNGNGDFEAAKPNSERSSLTTALFRSAYDQYLTTLPDRPFSTGR